MQMQLKHKLELLGYYILVLEQFILLEPEDGTNYAFKHNSMLIVMSCYKTYLYDMVQELEMHDRLVVYAVGCYHTQHYVELDQLNDYCWCA